MLTSQKTKLANKLPGAARCLTVAALGMLWPTVAAAHFKLNEPAAYSKQDYDNYGSPQKSAPCGQADPGVPIVMTGVVNNYVAGQKITLQIDEKIPHPGWYRVSIAQDLASLPADPKVTSGATDCESTPIDPNPKLPLIADGIFVHTKTFSNPVQTTQIQLPPGFTCNNCILQVTEWMSNHGFNNPGGCFYHHCATVNITAAASDGGTGPVDAGTSTPADLATAPPVETQPSGCSYQLSAVPPSAVGMLAGLLTFGMLLRRRRRASA